MHGVPEIAAGEDGHDRRPQHRRAQARTTDATKAREEVPPAQNTAARTCKDKAMIKTVCMDYS